MIRTIIFLFSIILLSCDDGNFDTPDFDFSSGIKNCGDLVLYKIGTTNNNEALILNISGSDFKNVEGTVSLTIGSARTVTYRVFDDTVDSNYFCQDVPPTTPTTIQNWIGTGSIKITTTEEVDEDNIGTGVFTNQINLINLVITNDSEGKLSFNDYDFGVYETEITN
ncbi:MAG: hypothetical protein WBN17_05255 [Aureibaculum sp.]